MEWITDFGKILIWPKGAFPFIFLPRCRAMHVRLSEACWLPESKWGSTERQIQNFADRKSKAATKDKSGDGNLAQSLDFAAEEVVRANYSFHHTTFSRKPYYETRNESFSSLSVAFYAIWDNLWGSGYEAPFEAENSFRAEFSGNFLPSRSYKGGEEERVEAPNKSGKSFDIKIVPPSPPPSSAHRQTILHDQTSDLKTGAALKSMKISQVALCSSSWVAEQINSCRGRRRQNTEHRRAHNYAHVGIFIVVVVVGNSRSFNNHIKEWTSSWSDYPKTVHCPNCPMAPTFSFQILVVCVGVPIIVVHTYLLSGLGKSWSLGSGLPGTVSENVENDRK